MQIAIGLLQISVRGVAAITGVSAAKAAWGSATAQFGAGAMGWAFARR